MEAGDSSSPIVNPNKRPSYLGGDTQPPPLDPFDKRVIRRLEPLFEDCEDKEGDEGYQTLKNENQELLVENERLEQIIRRLQRNLKIKDDTIKGLNIKVLTIEAETKEKVLMKQEHHITELHRKRILQLQDNNRRGAYHSGVLTGNSNTVNTNGAENQKSTQTERSVFCSRGTQTDADKL